MVTASFKPGFAYSPLFSAAYSAEPLSIALEYVHGFKKNTFFSLLSFAKGKRIMSLTEITRCF